MSIKNECINVITELCDIAKLKKGDILVKYGCKIGYALEDIKKGEHVHTWNLDSTMR